MPAFMTEAATSLAMQLNWRLRPGFADCFGLQIIR